MHIEAFLLGIVDSKSRIGGKSVFGLFVVKPVISLQNNLSCFVLKEHITKHFTLSGLPVIEDGIPNQYLGTVVAVNFRAIKQVRFLGHRVIPSLAGMYIPTVRNNAGGAQDIGVLRFGIVFQRICIDDVIFIDQLHAVAEQCLFGIWAILPPERGEFILLIHQHSPLEIVAEVHHPVIIETICEERGSAIFHSYIIPQPC